MTDSSTPSSSDTMPAAVYHGDHDIRVGAVPVPVRGPGEVLIRVTRSGLCGTDATEWAVGPKVFPCRSRTGSPGITVR